MRVKQQGFSLIETLVSLVVSAVALLGLAAGQIKSLQFATSSLDYTLSIVQANNSVERVWVNLCDLQNGTVQFANLDLSVLDDKYTITFPNDFNQDDFQVEVSWSDKRLTDNLATEVTLNAKFPEIC